MVELRGRCTQTGIDVAQTLAKGQLRKGHAAKLIRATELAHPAIAVVARGRCGGGKEVAIPVYERLQAEPRLGERIRDILVRGVSTRKYAEVLPRMAGTVGIAKSSVSRRFIRASRDALEALMGRRFDELDILAVWIDGIVVDATTSWPPSASRPSEAKHLLGLGRARARTPRWSRTCSRP